jgi:hypothetical protein
MKTRNPAWFNFFPTNVLDNSWGYSGDRNLGNWYPAVSGRKLLNTFDLTL